VPPTSEQREASLENARMAVLSSNDPEMQLSWAQDSLAYVEVAIQNEVRLSLIQPPRPQTPQVEHQLKVDAMNVVNFLADQYHPKADFIRGTWLEFGKFGFRVDKREAFRSYMRSAEKGYARAEYRIGMQFESSGEPEKAVRHYEKGVGLADSASYYVRLHSYQTRSTC
jgi:TPR repeat protein